MSKIATKPTKLKSNNNLSTMKDFLEKYKDLNLFVIAVKEKLPINNFGNPMLNWEKNTYETHCKSHHFLLNNQETDYGVSLMSGEHSGRHLIVLDLDIYDKSGVPCLKTQQHYEQLLKLSNGVGMFSGSTCGNYGCVLDITGEENLIKSINEVGNKCKFDINRMEVRFNKCHTVLPPSITMCKVHQKNCCARRFITELSILKNSEVCEWLVNLIATINNKKENKIIKNTPTINKIKSNSFDYTIKLTKVEIATIEGLLNSLPSKYYTEYNLWCSVCWSLKSFSNTKECFELFDSFSKKVQDIDKTKYDYNSVCNTWKHGDNRTSIGTLIYFHKSNCNECKNNLKCPLKNANSTLFRDEHINLMNNVENISIKINDRKFKIDINEFDSEFITNTKGECSIFKVSEKTLNNKTIFIKSHTGSGKTTLMSSIQSYFKNKNYDIKSITSRTSLSITHSNLFDIDNYKNVKLNDEYIQNISIQLDSLMKLITNDTKFILLLDEVNSLIHHIRASTMTKQRKNIINKFIDIYNKASFVIGIDADISSIVLKFIADINKNNRKMKLYWNKHELKNSCDVLVNPDFDLDAIKSSIIEKINNKEPVYVCSDSYHLFEKHIVLPIKEHFKKHNMDIFTKIKFFSSMDGNKDDLLNPKKLFGCYIFCTPSIIYGIDFNFASTVFGIYFCNNCMNALNCIQQINRIRKPKQIVLYFKKHNIIPSFFSLDDFISFYENPNIKNELKALQISNMSKFKDLEAYKQFVYESEYQNMRLMNLSFHVVDILKHKQHKIIYVEPVKPIKQKKICVNNIYDDFKDAELARIIKDQLNINIEDEDYHKLEVFQKRIMIIDNLINTSVCDVINTTEYAKDDYLVVKDLFKQMIYDNHAFTSFINLYNFNRITNDEQYNQFIKDTNEVSIIDLLKNNKLKLFEIYNLKNTFKIDNLFNCSVDDFINNAPFTVDENIKKVFNLRGKKYNQPLDGIQQYQLLMDLSHGLFDTFMEFKTQQINKKKYYLKIFNNEVLKPFIDILYSPVLIDKRKSAFVNE